MKTILILVSLNLLLIIFFSWLISMLVKLYWKQNFIYQIILKCIVQMIWSLIYSQWNCLGFFQHIVIYEKYSAVTFFIRYTFVLYQYIYCHRYVLFQFFSFLYFFVQWRWKNYKKNYLFFSEETNMIYYHIVIIRIFEEINNKKKEF